MIELLVVIAIIAILAAILFPVFAQAREKARQTVCLSNMKQISTGMIMYTSDYDGYWPRSYGCSATPLTNVNAKQPWSCIGAGGSFALEVNHYKWQGWIMPYVKNVDIFFCPSRIDAAKTDPNWADSGEIHNAYALSTPVTGYVTSSFDSRSFLGNGSLSALQTPAETFIVMEGPAPTTSSYYPKDGPPVETIYPMAYREIWNTYLYQLLSRTANGKLDVNYAPHSNGFTFAYCDGHAKWLPVGHLGDQANSNSFLGKCPTGSDYFASSGSSFGGAAPTTVTGVKGTFNQGDKVGVKGDWPLWGLVNNM